MFIIYIYLNIFINIISYYNKKNKLVEISYDGKKVKGLYDIKNELDLQKINNIVILLLSLIFVYYNYLFYFCIEFYLNINMNYFN